MDLCIAFGILCYAYDCNASRSYFKMCHSQWGQSCFEVAFELYYSHLFNKRVAWNKRGGGAKVAKSLNVELGINEEGGIFGKN